jgi:hypothetical protein
MKEFLQERIALFLLLLAGDTVSLIAFIKAKELKADALTLAICISLIPSILISVLIKYYFLPRVNKRMFTLVGSIISFGCWVAFVICYSEFNEINNQFGKMPFPKNRTLVNPVDSFIVAGCHYTPEAQAEVDDFARRKATLSPSLLFADFNYVVTNVWSENELDCARNKILNKFTIMFVFLILGITLTTEMIINLDKGKGKEGTELKSKTANQKQIGEI